MHTTSLRSEILQLVEDIAPLDHEEAEHLLYVQRWIDSGAGLFRVMKPATPDIHLVSYFLLIDTAAHKVLLADHKKAGLWLPTGGHVEPDEHPRATVEREIREELGIEADFLLDTPLFLTVTRTVGETAGHTDVSLWYVLRGDSTASFEYDREEFNCVEWFAIDAIPYERTDPHMKRFTRKLVDALSLKLTA